MKKNKFINLLLFLIIIGCFLLSSNSAVAEELTSPIEASSVPILIGSIIKAVLGVVGALALLMFVYGGFMWLTSGGNPDRIKKGKDTLVWATIGLIVIFASYTLVDFVIRTIKG